MKKQIISEFKAIFYLATPLIFNLLSYMAMQLIDTLMLGRLGAVALAAAALGNVVFLIILVACLGTLTAVGTLSAQAFGEKKPTEVRLMGQHGIWLAILLGIPSVLLIWYADLLLSAIKQPALVVLGAKQYLHGLAWGFLPDLCFITLREYVTAISKPRIIMLIAMSAVPLNAILNYWFMYGGAGLPAMHIYGVGLATSVVAWLMLIAIAIYIAREKSGYHLNILKMALPKLHYIKRIIKLGGPVGISFVIEEFLFVFTAILIGYFGVDSLAAHQIAIQTMFVFNMIPIGISQAAAIRVSQLSGESNDFAIGSAYIAIISGVAIAFIAASLMWLFPAFFVSLFINIHLANNFPVVILASKILIVIAIFHIFDAAQLITSGALRGYQDTLIPLFLSLFSFWLVGIGSGYMLGFVYQYGVIGLWSGLALGIIVSTVLLQFRLWLRHK